MVTATSLDCGMSIRNKVRIYGNKGGATQIRRKRKWSALDQATTQVAHLISDDDEGGESKIRRRRRWRVLDKMTT